MSKIMDIRKKITELKRERNAVIVAHYYAPPEVQDVADFLGDSLGLSRIAAGTDAETIVFGGVHFMAETAAIISPEKKVYAPAPDAGCSLADSVDAASLRKWKKEHPGGIVVSYVNTTAAVKAETDYCCTSANAVKVVESLPEGCEILFGPDRNLGAHIMKTTGRRMSLWDGVCTVHDVITPGMIREAAERYPDADILVHPEASCSSSEDILSGDNIFFYSTAGMLAHARKSEKKRFVIATETDTLHQLKKENPGKIFIPVSPGIVCREMKKVTLDGILGCLEKGEGEIHLEAGLRERALLPIRRMLEIG